MSPPRGLRITITSRKQDEITPLASQAGSIGWPHIGIASSDSAPPTPPAKAQLRNFSRSGSSSYFDFPISGPPNDTLMCPNSIFSRTKSNMDYSSFPDSEASTPGGTLYSQRFLPNYPPGTPIVREENPFFRGSNRWRQQKLLGKLGGVKQWCLAIKKCFLRHIDPKTVLEIVDIREYFWPITVRKYLVLLVVAMVVTGIIVSEPYTKWLEKSMAITRTCMWPVLAIVIGLEPCMSILTLILGRVPPLPVDFTRRTSVILEKAEPCVAMASAGAATSNVKIPTNMTAEIRNNSTALVVPCHNSSEAALTRVLECAYPHFRPQDIFIVDNSNSRYPTGNLRKFIQEQHRDIVYIWSPIGSKSAAVLVGALAARDYDYILTIDDDVCLPPNFQPPTDLINDKTRAVAFPLKAVDPNGRVPLFMVAWQDCEYRMAGLAKLAEAAVCGVLFPHGAGWFVERATLVPLIEKAHSIDFIADDVNAGLALQKMHLRIGFDARVVLETEVPTTILGPGLNWWKQRKNSWEMGRHSRLLAFADRLFLSLNGQTTLQGICAQKLVLLYSIATIAVDWVRVPVFVTMGNDPVYWRAALLLTLGSILPPLAYKYISCRHRPDLAPTVWGCLTYPLYKQIYSFVAICGGIRSIMYYIGGHSKPKSVRDMLRDKDDRIIWQDPRFEKNPAFLADEAEALAASQTSIDSDSTRDSAIQIITGSTEKYLPGLAM